MGMEAILKIPTPKTEKQVGERIPGRWGGILQALVFWVC